MTAVRLAADTNMIIKDNLMPESAKENMAYVP